MDGWSGEPWAYYVTVVCNVLDLFFNGTDEAKKDTVCFTKCVCERKGKKEGRQDGRTDYPKTNKRLFTFHSSLASLLLSVIPRIHRCRYRARLLFTVNPFLLSFAISKIIAIAHFELHVYT